MFAPDFVSISDVVQFVKSLYCLLYKLFCGSKRKIIIISYYRCNSNNDLALLTANLLLRDASDANPSIRSASISALAALPGIEESAVRALTSALSDQAAMVYIHNTWLTTLCPLSLSAQATVFDWLLFSK